MLTFICAEGNRGSRSRGWFFALLTLALPFIGSAAIQPAELKCEYRTSPLGIDTPKPRLSWILQSAERAQKQTAYQIVVASSAAQLEKGTGDLWDSGKVISSESIHIEYAGKPLKSGQQVFWKVKVWDQDSKASEFSKPATWEMGFLSPKDWKASWIARAQLPGPEDETYAENPAPLLRKEFAVGKKIARARAYVSGLGYYELYLNGKRVGDHVLDPGWTSYVKRILYSTYDVTEQLQQGTNAVGIMLGNGWFNPLPLKMWGHVDIRGNLAVGEPRAILQLHVEFTDGTSQDVVTDNSWKVGSGPILRNSVYLGEFYDARKEQAGWDRPGFKDSSWASVVLCTNQLGQLRAQDAPPIRITRTLKPVKMTEPKPGVYIFDFGQNFSGVARLKVKGPAGTKVRLRHGELLYGDGTLNGMTSVCGQIKAGGPNYVYDGQGLPKTAFQLDEYTLKGDGDEVFAPRFTFHGFRYVEITGFPGKPTLETVEGLRLNSDVAPVGSFQCSNDLFNRIQEAVLWTQLANIFSVQSDCPHREKFGYGGDIVSGSEMAMFNFDMARFYAKVVNDFSDDVRLNGGFTETAPFVGISDNGLGERSGQVGWGTAHPQLQWQLFQYYGERRVMEEQFVNTKRWLQLLQRSSTNGILDNGISDHESLVPKRPAVTGTAFFYLNATLFAQMANITHHKVDSHWAEGLAENVKTAFNAKFLDPKSGRYDTGSQACQSFALYLGLVPAEQEQAAINVLVRDIQETHTNHLSTGIFGTKYMLQALAAAGLNDVAYTIVNQKTYPGWGYMLDQGATTLWEHWAFSDNTYSHNHPMFGSVSEWFYKTLAGINPAPDAVGFDRILIYPQLSGDLKWVKGKYKSVRGEIVSEWEKTDDQFTLRITIPANVTATVFLPAKDLEAVTEGGKPVRQAVGVGIFNQVSDTVVLAVGSGSYTFSTKLK